jgi:hypothetical protein
VNYSSNPAAREYLIKSSPHRGRNSGKTQEMGCIEGFMRVKEAQ